MVGNLRLHSHFKKKDIFNIGPFSINQITDWITYSGLQIGLNNFSYEVRPKLTIYLRGTISHLICHRKYLLITQLFSLMQKLRFCGQSPAIVYKAFRPEIVWSEFVNQPEASGRVTTNYRQNSEFRGWNILFQIYLSNFLFLVEKIWFRKYKY